MAKTAIKLGDPLPNLEKLRKLARLGAEILNNSTKASYLWAKGRHGTR
ncbi:MAG: hypothetical protein QI223_08405 [Candidatus Korarchaeota archaeon]|nr:hypothetical protein [Candidatus Korarchaeota archaeon]